MRVIKFYQTSLRRQVGEAVRIRRRGEGCVLNSKSEFNRCRITRLTLPEEVRSHQNTQGDKSLEEREAQPEMAAKKPEKFGKLTLGFCIRIAD